MLMRMSTVTIIFLFICLRVLVTESSHANNICYPDQYPFEIEDCIGVSPLELDTANSTETIGPTDSGTITLHGGLGPFVWTISGSGFSFDPEQNMRTLSSTTPAAQIYTDNACGTGIIKITDGCGSEFEYSVRSTAGGWIDIGSFSPVNLKESGPHPYLDPRSLGMYQSSQTVAYTMSIPGYGTQASGSYVLQVYGVHPETYYDYYFSTGNSWGWAYYDDSLVDAPEGLITDPIVGRFTVRAFGGTQQRGPSYHKYYCAAASWHVWEWQCSP